MPKAVSRERLPAGVSADLFRRYQSIGNRMDRLYPLLFDAKLSVDLETLGFGSVLQLLNEVQARRNDFTHGNTEAIDDDLITNTIDGLPAMQGAWAVLFNLRCTGNPLAARVWNDRKHHEIANRSIPS